MKRVMKEIEGKVLKHLFDNTSIDNLILKEVKEGIDESINFSRDDSDHKIPKKASDSQEVWKFSIKEFPPIDEFTKIRRETYKKLKVDLQSKREKLKIDAVEGTKVSKEFDGEKIKIKIVNKSQLLTYLRGGHSGENSKKTSEQLEAERRFVYLTAKEMGILNDYAIQKYMSLLNNAKDHTAGILGKVPIRDVLSASAEKIGKDFIRKNIIK